MFTTIEQVKALTGYDVTQDVIIMAQSIIEVYVGRVEAEVTNPNDSALLGKATAYQAAYIRDNFQTVFEQADVLTSSSGMTSMSYKANNTTSPWIAPFAVIAAKHLSWLRMRAIKTGPTFGNKPEEASWATQ